MAVGPILAPSAPTRIDCLQCQLTGHRRLTCSKADICKELPHNFYVGPALLVGWAATVALFVFIYR